MERDFTAGTATGQRTAPGTLPPVPLGADSETCPARGNTTAVAPVEVATAKAIAVETPEGKALPSRDEPMKHLGGNCRRY